MKNKNKEWILNLIIIALFVVGTLVVASHHEPWSDEAQSWLIAKHQSVKDILFVNSRYEGTFPLWILTLKLFSVFGLPYSHMYVVSIVVSTLGLIILLFKTKVPTSMKILIPFSYYVFYQYTVIARNYCFLLLAFSLLISFYEKRHENIICYLGALIILSFISLHGMVISGTLFCCWFYERRKDNIKIDKKEILYIILIGLVYLFEIIVLFLPKDLYVEMNIKDNPTSFIYHMIVMMIIMSLTLNNGLYLVTLINLLAIVFLIIAFIKMKKSNNCWPLTVAEIALICFLIIIRVVSHHLGVLFMLLVTDLVINHKQNKEILLFLTLSLILYTVVSGISSYLDYYNNYSGSKEMAEYLIENNIVNQEDELECIGFKSVALEAYFDEKICASKDSKFYWWSKNNYDLLFYNAMKTYKKKDENTVKNLVKVYPKYLIVPEHNMVHHDDFIRKIIDKNDDYELIYKTEGKLFFKGSYNETEGYYLYKLKEK